MSNTKIYLSVPYAEKDAAKALGARWDATAKKWYATPNLDISLFAKWTLQASSPESSSASPHRSSSTPTATNKGSGVFTYPSSKDFVAYDGDEPPWD